MAITKLKDLERHIFVDDERVTITHKQGAWVRFDEVQELVNHLQSKYKKRINKCQNL